MEGSTQPRAEWVPVLQRFDLLQNRNSPAVVPGLIGMLKENRAKEDIGCRR